MALDPRYITAIDLSPYLVDKDSGAPLSNGVVSFWQDDARTVPKLVYELSGAPPNYTYTALPNPITLSNTGTLQDANGNNIAVYYFPYDSQLPDANVQLYYITVTNSMGTEQFTREAWPNIVTNESQSITQANISNEITNPQFADVLFNPISTLTITTTGAGVLNVVVAPGWTLNITSTGIGTVTVVRNSITGSTAYPYNPPYTLSVTAGINITNLTLSQRMYHNPSIWSPQSGGTNGYLATSILLAPLNSLSIQYSPSVGTPQTLLTANNTLGTYQEFTNTVQLTAASNTSSSVFGYVDIIIVLPIGTTTTFSNVQVVGLETDITNVVYDQTSVNRQLDYTFHYYNPLLQYKPIASYLCGWDFPLNPAQFLTSTVAAQSVGANKSFYAWDQTIVFQSANSGVSVSRGANGEFVLTAASTGVQPAIIQYLDKPAVNEILNSRISSAIESKTSNTTGITGTISLWYCTDASLPSVAAGTNNSIVATLDANGHPATYNGTWVEVPRSNLGNAQFTATTNATTNFNFNGFSGWDMQGIAATQTANFFAIVVGFGAMTSGNTISINSVSVVPGDIPTKPAPQSISAVLMDCSRYYTKSFLTSVVPATAAGNEDAIFFSSDVTGTTSSVCQQILYITEMRTLTPAITVYSPQNSSNLIYNYNTNASVTATTLQQAGTKSFCLNYTGDSGCIIRSVLGFHYTADARLGII